MCAVMLGASFLVGHCLPSGCDLVEFSGRALGRLGDPGRKRVSFRHAWELSENKELWSWASVSSRNDAHSAHDTNYQDYSMVVRRENGSPAQLTIRPHKAS